MGPRKWAGRVKRRLLRPLRQPRAVADEFRQRLDDGERRLRRLQETVGRIEARQLGHAPAGAGLQAHEFRVYSQWGEDGIIDRLVSEVPVEREVFVEFGVESYQEANTRFLLVNRNWAGLVMDGDARQVERIRRHRDYWLYNLKAVHAFVTRDNIDRLLAENGVTGPIGLLSIDIDGMDYWIWEAITAIDPAIVVVEYNYRFGPDAAVTVPYRDDFDRRRAHHSILYYGASLTALCGLARRKGYAFVGAGSAGLNAFFVRRDLMPDTLRELTAAEGFVAGQYDEAHDAEGRRHRMSYEEEHALVMGLPLTRVGEER